MEVVVLFLILVWVLVIVLVWVMTPFLKALTRFIMIARLPK